MRALVALFTLGFSYMLACYIVRGALPYLAVEVGADPVWVARVLYIGFIVLTALTPFAGYLCDRFGSLRVARIATILVSLVITLYALTINIPMLLVVRASHAALGELLLAASLGVAAAISSTGGAGFGVLRFGQGLGVALGIAIGGVITTLLGARASMILAALATMAPLPIYLSIRAPESKRQTLTLSKAFRETIRVVKHPLILSEVMAAAAQVAGFTLILSYYTSYLVTMLKWAPWMYAAFLASESVAFSIGSLVSERMYETLGPISLAVEGYMLALTYYILASINNFIHLTLIAAPLGFLNGLVYTPAYREASRRAKVGRATIANVIDTIVVIYTSALVAALDPLLKPGMYRFTPLIASLMFTVAATAIAVSSLRKTQN